MKEVKENLRNHGKANTDEINKEESLTFLEKDLKDVQEIKRWQMLCWLMRN